MKRLSLWEPSHKPVQQNPAWNPVDYEYIEGIDGGSDLEERLNIEHPEYSANVDLWVKIEDLIQGGHQLKNKAAEYLPRRIGEDIELYNKRLREFTSTPEMTESVRALIDRMMTGDLLVESTNPIITEIIGSIDMMDFIGRSMQHWLIYGRSVVTYDTDWQGKIRPVLLNPISLINWGFEKHTNLLEWGVIKTSSVVTQPLKKPEFITRWTVVDPLNITIYEKVGSGVPQRKSKNRLPGISTLRLYTPPAELWTCSQAYLLQLQHIALENSANDAATRLIIQTVMRDGDGDLSNTAYDSGFHSSNHHVVFGDLDFVEAKGSSVQVIIELLKRISQKIRSIIEMVPIDNQSKVESAKSKEVDEKGLESTLTTYGSHLKIWLETTLQLLAQVSINRPDDSLVVLGLSDFKVGNLQVMLEQTQILWDLQQWIAPTALKQHLMKLADQITGVQKEKTELLISAEVEEIVSKMHSGKQNPPDEDLEEEEEN